MYLVIENYQCGTLTLTMMNEKATKQVAFQFHLPVGQGFFSLVPPRPLIFFAFFHIVSTK